MLSTEDDTVMKQMCYLLKMVYVAGVLSTEDDIRDTSAIYCRWHMW